MVKYAVQDNLHIVLVEIPADIGEILVCPETAVELSEISCVVAVVVRLEDRI